jgi:hypothetical protein
MNRSIYNHAECFMRRFKLKISASGTCQNYHATLFKIVDKNAQKIEKKETSQIEHPVFRIFV